MNKVDKVKTMRVVRDVVREAIFYGRMLKRREVEIKVSGLTKLTKTVMNAQHKKLYKMKAEIKALL